MSGTSRARVARDAERRTAESRVRIAEQVRTARRRRGWTQAALADRAGLGRQVIGRIELGQSRLDLDALFRIGVALGRHLDVTFARDLLDGPIDAGHLAMQELILRLGRAAGYRTGMEVPTRPAEPARSVDVALTSVTDHVVVICECWNTLGDIGAALRSTDRKRAEMSAAAAGRWGPDARAASVWVVRATARNRALLARYPEVFQSRFPASSRAWVAALTGAGQVPEEPGLIWTDVGATRLLEWRRSG